ncbi:hypothetical protein GO755_40175 [Spirosoma sp. HMF4905]|uniref:Uncharacterized protein n=1 Tax=Spirosoma arboris TaxID=2682092 RepID=A0A7K1SR68_9BACT|nr:hypothetical protein [Spirosoma arboris]MVM36292.1 hypothetical protein [Spirosoma arboris]
MPKDKQAEVTTILLVVLLGLLLVLTAVMDKLLQGRLSVDDEAFRIILSQVLPTTKTSS